MLVAVYFRYHSSSGLHVQSASRVQVIRSMAQLSQDVASEAAFVRLFTHQLLHLQKACRALARQLPFTRAQQPAWRAPGVRLRGGFGGG
jgi:hypothetical protein